MRSNIMMSAACTLIFILVVVDIAVGPPISSEISPNMGAWWYLLIEAFRQFQSYFLLVLALYPLFYIAPMAIRLRSSEPFMVSA